MLKIQNQEGDNPISNNEQSFVIRNNSNNYFSEKNEDNPFTLSNNANETAKKESQQFERYNSDNSLFTTEPFNNHAVN